jgi:serine/threonine protein kinase
VLDSANNDRPLALKSVKVFEEGLGLPLSFYREWACLLDLQDCENIAKLVYIVSGPAMGFPEKRIYLMLEHCEYDLGYLIVKNQLGDVARARCYMRQILVGLQQMHSRQYVHRDIKPENILITENNVVKLCDFGLSRRYPALGDATRDVGTPSYKAPELILQDKKHLPPGDIWAAGCVFFDIATGHRLFPPVRTDIEHIEQIFALCGTFSDTDAEYFRNACRAFEIVQPTRVLRSTLAARLARDIPAKFREEGDLADLIAHMLVLDPTARISVDSALEHPFFSGCREPHEFRKLKGGETPARTRGTQGAPASLTIYRIVSGMSRERKPPSPVPRPQEPEDAAEAEPLGHWRP